MNHRIQQAELYQIFLKCHNGASECIFFKYCLIQQAEFKYLETVDFNNKHTSKVNIISPNSVVIDT